MINIIIAAGGKGNRFSSKTPKQFTKINNHEILTMNILKWLKIEEIQKIYLVLPKFDFDFYKNKYVGISDKIIFVKGGDSRAASIYNAVKILDTSNKFTLIHDGARPFFTEKLVKNIMENLKKFQAVIPALKLTDTIKLVKEDKIVKTLNRENFVAVQTPQGFHTDLIIRAYNSIDFKDINFDDSELVEKLGISPIYIIGEKTNIKITSPEDIYYAEYLSKSFKI
jgi:2-C-methyl-D-erythritol 4-phosphate cytidylyltransferase